MRKFDGVASVRWAVARRIGRRKKFIFGRDDFLGGK